MRNYTYNFDQIYIQSDFIALIGEVQTLYNVIPKIKKILPIYLK